MTTTLSASAVRYLLAIYDLSGGRLAVRSVDIAARLSVTPSSVVHMLGVLSGQKLITKRHYGNVQMTTSGIQAARRLRNQLERLEHFFTDTLQVDAGTAGADALACLCTLSDQSLEQMMGCVQRRALSSTPLLPSAGVG